MRQITIGTNDVSVNVNSAFISITDPASRFIIRSTLGFTADPVFDFVIGLVFSVVAGCITFVVINPTKDNYFYKKSIMAEDFTNSKQYIKGTIWIERILFSEIKEI